MPIRLDLGDLLKKEALYFTRDEEDRDLSTARLPPSTLVPTGGGGSLEIRGFWRPVTTRRKGLVIVVPEGGEVSFRAGREPIRLSVSPGSRPGSSSSRRREKRPRKRGYRRKKQ